MFLLALSVQAAAVARITRIEGTIQIQRKGTTQWRVAKPAVPLNVGDKLFTAEESFAEIRYTIGTVLRMDEKTKIQLESSSDKTLKTRNSLGDVWVNMKKLVTKGKEFQVSTPTAVAAIRGTVFRLSNDSSSSVEVSVYDGKVGVGLADSLKKQLNKTKSPSKSMQPTEVNGPEEVPGPYEVTLEQWRDIVAGQQISVHADGKFAQQSFDMDKSAEENFVKKNLELDKELMQEK
jgi:uncharacterized protein YaiE (UPF0345 family)